MDAIFAGNSETDASELAMADGGGLQSPVLRLSLLLLLLGLASLQLQAWTSRKTVEGSVSSQEVVKSTRSVKHKHIVQGEAAGQGISDRVQCEDFLSKNGSMEASKQTLLRVRPCSFLEKETISFVTLFVLPETERIQKKKAISIRKMEKKNLHAVLRAFLESIQLLESDNGITQQLMIHWLWKSMNVQVSMPGTTRMMIISNQRKLKELPQNVDWRVTTRQYNRRNLMVQRLESYIVRCPSKRCTMEQNLWYQKSDLLEEMMQKRKNSSASSITHVILSDFDIIVVDDLGCLFRDFPLFDVALTYRNNRRQPINSGVIMVRGTLDSLSRAKALLKEVVKVFRSKFGHAFGVLGDQLALADIVKATLQTRKAEGVPFEAMVMATRSLFLPCAIYNWTPSEGAGQFHGMPTDVKILHFKGSRKRLMIHAWSLHKKQLNVKDFSNMKCLVLKSGRSKYDY